MRAYFKILGITLLMQMLLLGFSHVAYCLNWGFRTEIVLLFCSFIIPMAAGITAAVKWCKDTRHRLCCIFLMPTNYTLPVFLGLAVYKFDVFLEMLSSMPENFG